MRTNNTTPRPWSTKDVSLEHDFRQPGSYDAHDIALVGSDGICVGIVWDFDGKERENAALIERAVNAHDDALTLLRWVSDCWQDGELRGDFDDCVDAIRAFLGDRPAAPGEGER